MDKINYFSAEEAILLHDIEVIEKIGGLHGVLSEINEKTVLIDCEGIVLEFDRAAIRTVTPGTAVTNDSAVTSVPVTEVEETVTEEVTEVPETSDPSKEKKD